MTTEELIKKLKENKRVDVVVIMALDGIKKLVILNDMSRSLLRIPTTATNWLDLEVVDSQLIADSLGTKSRKYVSAQISEYLNTPLNKREPEKKYRLRWLDSDDPKLDHETYLGRDYPDSGGYNWVTCNKDMAEVFTEHELEKLKDENADYAMIIEAMKEEVKGDAC